MQTAPVQQQKAASEIYMSKAFFRVIPVLQAQAWGSRHSKSTSRRSQTKNHENAGWVIRSVADADVYIEYVQGGGLCYCPRNIRSSGSIVADVNVKVSGGQSITYSGVGTLHTSLHPSCFLVLHCSLVKLLGYILQALQTPVHFVGFNSLLDIFQSRPMWWTQQAKQKITEL